MTCPALLEVPVKDGEHVAPTRSTLPPCVNGDDWETYGNCPMTGKKQCPTDPAEQAKCPSC